MNKVRAYLARKYHFDPTDTSAVWSYSLSKFAQQFIGLFDAIAAFIWVVGIGTIIAGIVGVSNIMLITVKERTKEIGLRKALGATPMSIVSLIVQEAIVLTTVAGYTGLMLGVGLLEGLNYFMEKNNIKNDYFKSPEVDFNIAISALLLLIFCGTVAGLIPAIRASKISPIEALRDE
jgi:putative ABC transport system permease protein